jgi:hypothetical protein
MAASTQHMAMKKRLFMVLMGIMIVIMGDVADIEKAKKVC